MNYQTLIDGVKAVIKQNGNEEITGDLLQQTLLAMISALGAGYQFMGFATPDTNPGTPDQNVFYLTFGPGVYTNFDGIEFDNEIGALVYNGTWTKQCMPALNFSPIMTGQLVWNVNAFYSASTGAKMSDSSFGYVCTLKYPKMFHDAMLDKINAAVSTYDYTQISFWKNGVYAGYRVQSGYKLPDGTTVASIEFDTFAINVRATQIPDYQTRFVVPSIVDIQTVADENTLMLHTFANGQLVWYDGAFYSASAGAKITGSVDWYSCSEKYPQAYYYLLADIVDALFVASDYTQISFWKNGVYVGYRIRNGYHRPDGTAVEILVYDQFAINLDTRAITDYRTRVVFPSLGGGDESHVFGRAFYALGDSTTAGAGSSQSPVKSWANYLTELATFPSFTKLAISGAFCVYHEGYGRLSTEIDSVPANTTGIVTIMIGTNDFFYDSPLGDAATALAANYADLDDTTTFANAFRYCLEKLKRKAPNAVIVVMQPLPSFDAGNAHGHLDETNLFAIRDIERTICNAMGIPIVETQYEFGLSRYTDNWNFFFSDFCHPNDTGYLRIAHCMLGKFIELCQ